MVLTVPLMIVIGAPVIPTCAALLSAVRSSVLRRRSLRTIRIWLPTASGEVSSKSGNENGHRRGANVWPNDPLPKTIEVLRQVLPLWRADGHCSPFPHVNGAAR